MDRRVIAERVAANYPAVADDLLSPLLEVMSKARSTCGGDMDKVLILMVIAVRTSQHPEFAAASQAALLSGEVPIFPSLGINMRSIAESIGAARETVRRKVGELVEAGWIVRRGNGLCFTYQGYLEVAGVREAIEALAARNFEVVFRLMRDELPGDRWEPG